MGEHLDQRAILKHHQALAGLQPARGFRDIARVHQLGFRDGAVRVDESAHAWLGGG